MGSLTLWSKKCTAGAPETCGTAEELCIIVRNSRAGQAHFLEVCGQPAWIPSCAQKHPFGQALKRRANAPSRAPAPQAQVRARLPWAELLRVLGDELLKCPRARSPAQQERFDYGAGDPSYLGPRRARGQARTGGSCRDRRWVLHRGVLALQDLPRHCERSEAIQRAQLDCFVAALLAMTILALKELRRTADQLSREDCPDCECSGACKQSSGSNHRARN